MEQQKIEKINKFIPELDLTINKIEYPFKEQDYFLVEFSLYESLGEMGEYYTEFYDEYPKEEELIKDIKEHLKEVKKELEEQYGDTKDEDLSGREENYLRVLRKIERGHKFKPIVEILIEREEKRQAELKPIEEF